MGESEVLYMKFSIHICMSIYSLILNHWWNFQVPLVECACDGALYTYTNLCVDACELLFLLILNNLCFLVTLNWVFWVSVISVFLNSFIEM